MGNRVYDLEFQKEAVKLLYKRGGKVTEVSRSLGIPISTLKTWGIKLGHSIKEEKIKPNKKSKEEKIFELEEENRRLRKEISDTNEDNLILKKSISIFLKRPLT